MVCGLPCFERSPPQLQRIRVRRPENRAAQDRSLQGMITCPVLVALGGTDHMVGATPRPSLWRFEDELVLGGGDGVARDPESTTLRARAPLHLGDVSEHPRPSRPRPTSKHDQSKNEAQADCTSASELPHPVISAEGPSSPHLHGEASAVALDVGLILPSTAGRSTLRTTNTASAGVVVVDAT